MLLLAAAACLCGGCMKPKEFERDVRGAPASRVGFCNTPARGAAKAEGGCAPRGPRWQGECDADL